MKKYLLAGVLLLVTVPLLMAQQSRTSENSPPQKGQTMRVSCSPDIEHLVQVWVTEYNESRPGNGLIRSTIEDSYPGKMHGKNDLIGIFSKYYLPDDPDNSKFRMVIGREVYVPVMNVNNPDRGKVLETGLSTRDFQTILGASSPISWGSVLQDGNLESVHVYYPRNETALSCVSEFTGIPVPYLARSKNSVDQGVLDYVKKDPYAIGFCRLGDLLTGEESAWGKSVAVIPIDLNENRKIDHTEDIYSSGNDLVRGIWIGKYPGSLFTRIYLVSSGNTEAGNQYDFLEWVLTKGQSSLGRAGYTALLPSERQSGLALLASKSEESPLTSTGAQSVMTIILVSLAALMLLVLWGIMAGRRRKNRDIQPAETYSDAISFKERSLDYPAGLFFDRGHTWSIMEKKGYVRSGIDEFLTHIAGPVTRVDLREPGDVIRRGEPYFSLIQQGKKLVINSPVSGIIRERNTLLYSDPSRLNRDPYSEGWIYLIEPAGWLEETRSFLMGSKVAEWIKNEVERLRDFLSGRPGEGKATGFETVLQEGGELMKDILVNLGPECWEDFQNQFLDKRSRKQYTA